MTATDDRRADLTNRMADFVLAHGLAAASLRPLAAAAGISDRMLLYYFKDKSEVIGATLDAIVKRLPLLLAAHTTPNPLPLGRLRGRVVALMLGADIWPYMQLWLDLVAAAARGDALCRKTGQTIENLCATWVQPQLLSNGPGEAARLMMMIRSAVMNHAIGQQDSPD